MPDDDSKNVWKLQYKPGFESGEYVVWEDENGGEIWFRPKSINETRGIGVSRHLTIDDAKLRGILREVHAMRNASLGECRQRMVDALNASGLRPQAKK
jgi:hypothetical protein